MSQLRGMQLWITVFSQTSLLDSRLTRASSSKQLVTKPVACVLKRGEEIEHMPQQPPLNSTGMDCTLTVSMQTVSGSGCQETASCELLMLANTVAVGIELSPLEILTFNLNNFCPLS